VPIYAALDLGTNNCRLLIARPHNRGFQVIDAFSRIVRLGEGLGTSGRLSEPAMLRTLSALQICADKMRRRRVSRVRSIATAACRLAKNGDEFIDQIKRETGLLFEVISSEEEASLAVVGCRPLMSPDARDVLVFDIGGGSTEITWLEAGGSGRSARASLSIPEGVVTLAERFGGGDIDVSDYERMIANIRDHLSPFEAQHRLGTRIGDGGMQMVGTSGTVTTLAGVHLGLPRYDRNMVDGTWLTFEQAIRTSAMLRNMSMDERAQHPCIGRGRADLVVAGCAVLEAICRTWPVGRLRVGDRGLREGILLSMMRADRNARSRAKSA
jgi:exopolyphosphatase/guanosine-5'-triphosphate,3'-diphosphate pyrophosphatase